MALYIPVRKRAHSLNLKDANTDFMISVKVGIGYPPQLRMNSIRGYGG
jgi:hypothetical protein